MKTQAIGNQGEILAKNFLAKSDFNILHTNWYYKHKELDITATKNNILHIIEVKTRTTSCQQSPQDAVNITKQRNIIFATEAYINQYNIELEVQFDIICIVIENNSFKLEYIPNAFKASEVF